MMLTPTKVLTVRELSNYLRVHFAHMRAKLEPDPSHPHYVITDPGVGYRLRDDS